MGIETWPMHPDQVADLLDEVTDNDLGTPDKMGKDPEPEITDRDEELTFLKAEIGWAEPVADHLVCMECGAHIEHGYMERHYESLHKEKT